MSSGAKRKTSTAKKTVARKPGAKKSASRKSAKKNATPSKAKSKKPTAKKVRARSSASGILVTGATGFLGKHLVSALRDPATVGGSAEARRTIRALVRTPTLHLERHAIETRRGDVCAPEECRAAMDGVSEVYHLAGRVSRRPEDATELYRIHVEGTREVLAAAAAAKVKRVVVVSTSGTLAVSEQPEVSTEESPLRTDVVRHWPYYLSKIYQEQTALRLGEELGLEVVIVNPSLLLGPGDDRGSSTGDVEQVVRGRLPIIPKGGGLAFVDARDAALGCIAAMKRGRPGERYLLSAENVTLETFMGRVARLAGVATPRAILEPATAKWAGKWMGALLKPLDM
ncbi:MAG: NAD-dependent epimerase/dehydratase family protein, partial [Myxococcota bacterium]